MNNIDLSTFFQSGCFLTDPELNKIWILDHPISYESNETSEFAFYNNNFFLNENKPWLKSKTYYELDIKIFKEILMNYKSSKPNLNWLEPNIKKYKKQFFSLKDEIRNKKLIKGVPFLHQSSHFEMQEENLVYLIKNLFENVSQQKLYLYGYWIREKNFGFIGASPELIFIQNKNLIKTYALAGTVNKNLQMHEINNKIISEHNIVIDGIKNELEKYGNIHIENMKILELEKFNHLKSILKLNLKKDFDFNEILNSIHPTPALGAFRKDFGIKWLNFVESEIEKRFFYCGVCGIQFHKDKSLCIGIIRGLQWQNNLLKITAGGGVIDESVFEDELNEIISKMDSVKNYFSL